MKKVHTIKKNTPKAANLKLPIYPTKWMGLFYKLKCYQFTDKVDPTPYLRAKAQERNPNCNLALKKMLGQPSEKQVNVTFVSFSCWTSKSHQPHPQHLLSLRARWDHQERGGWRGRVCGTVDFTQAPSWWMSVSQRGHTLGAGPAAVEFLEGAPRTLRYFSSHGPWPRSWPLPSGAPRPL